MRVEDDKKIISEAAAMREPIDPHIALSSLNQTLENAAREHEISIE